MMLAVIPGLIAGLGLAVIAWALIPGRPDLVDALARVNTTEAVDAPSRSRKEQIGSWAHQSLPEITGLSPNAKDLDLLGITPAEHHWRKIYVALLGLALPGVLGLALQVIAGVPLYIPALLGLPLALLLWVIPDLEVKEKAKEARAEFVRAIGSYYELVASERRSNSSPGASLLTAAEVSDVWIFQRIRHEIRRGQFAGVQPWNAIAELAEEIDVPELLEIARIVQLSGEGGAQIYEPLRARGRALRLEKLAAEQTAANEVSESMSIPLSALGLIFIGIVITPAALSFSQSF